MATNYSYKDHLTQLEKNINCFFPYFNISCEIIQMHGNKTMQLRFFTMSVACDKSLTY